MFLTCLIIKLKYISNRVQTHYPVKMKKHTVSTSEEGRTSRFAVASFTPRSNADEGKIQDLLKQYESWRFQLVISAEMEHKTGMGFLGSRERGGFILEQLKALGVSEMDPRVQKIIEEVEDEAENISLARINADHAKKRARKALEEAHEATAQAGQATARSAEATAQAVVVQKAARNAEVNEDAAWTRARVLMATKSRVAAEIRAREGDEVKRQFEEYKARIAREGAGRAESGAGSGAGSSAGEGAGSSAGEGAGDA